MTKKSKKETWVDSIGAWHRPCELIISKEEVLEEKKS